MQEKIRYRCPDCGALCFPVYKGKLVFVCPVGYNKQYEQEEVIESNESSFTVFGPFEIELKYSKGEQQCQK